MHNHLHRDFHDYASIARLHVCLAYWDTISIVYMKAKMKEMAEEKMYLYIRHSDRASHGSICLCSRLDWEHEHRGMKSHSLDLVCTTMTCLSAPLSAQSDCSPVYPYLDLSKVKQIQTLGNWNFVRNGNELRLEWNAWLRRSRKECRVGGSSRWNV